MTNFSRRELLKLGALSVSATVSGCSTLESVTSGPRSGGSSSRNATGTSAGSTATTKPELRRRIDDLETRIAELKSTLGEKDARITELEADVASLRTALERKNETVRALESKLQDKEERIRTIESQSGQYQYSADVRERATDAGKQLRNAVVVLEFELEDGFQSGGTGWFIDEDHIVTNRHVVMDLAEGRTEEVTGYLIDGTEFDFSLKNMTDSRDDDVALLETSQSPLYVPPRGSASSLSEGQPIIQVGNPSLIGNWVISLGEFVEPARFSNAFLSEMPSKNGNSGSPVATLDGTVVGLTYGGVSRGDVSGAPEPSEPVALEEYPYQKVQYGEHESIETVEKYYDEWTG